MVGEVDVPLNDARGDPVYGRSKSSLWVIVVCWLNSSVIPLADR